MGIHEEVCVHAHEDTRHNIIVILDIDDMIFDEDCAVVSER